MQITVVPGIGRTRLGQRTSKCAFLIGTRSAQSIRASGHTAASTGRTRDRTRPMLQSVRKHLPGRRPHVTHSGHQPVSHIAVAKSHLVPFRDDPLTRYDASS
jgi:hypothetical protein